MQLLQIYSIFFPKTLECFNKKVSDSSPTLEYIFFSALIVYDIIVPVFDGTKQEDSDTVFPFSNRFEAENYLLALVSGNGVTGR